MALKYKINIHLTKKKKLYCNW